MWRLWLRGERKPFLLIYVWVFIKLLSNLTNLWCSRWRFWGGGLRMVPPSLHRLQHHLFSWIMPAQNAFWQLYVCMLARRVPFSPGGAPCVPLWNAWSHMPPARRGCWCAGLRTSGFGLGLKMDGNCVPWDKEIGIKICTVQKATRTNERTLI